MTDRSKFSDEQLTAYLDGEFEHTPALEIERALKTSTKLQKRLADLNFAEDELKDAMNGLLATAPEMPKLPGSSSSIKSANDNTTTSPWMRRSLVAASAAMMMLVGGAIGYNISAPEQTDWRGYVAAYQFLYINNTLAHVSQSDEDAARELERVGDAIGKELELASLSNVTGLDYKRSQILGFNGKPLAQITFLSKMGTPIALCVIRNGKTGEPNIDEATMEGMAAASWVKDGYEYLLIGGKDKTLIDSAAEYFSAKI